ncbi:hypothetical protein [Mucilaginibacter sp. L3T2-6]|uniref:hypothetical protein n=1 Tax=Mucilaginibacter sp. L3T2-6 TaxID=3062491 RepID=UPI002675FF72|nr:hypothetical protein [Mucilaginibacter sp. L3T2-6]MDO3641956.1 hypothetical protein [Mucilaginibacter sp. L3T2-6]MDV6214366.1 hypothetical protein [Mucilaginibacter sp. L3T2-6]
MKTIGAYQMLQKTYDTINVGGEWGECIPEIPKGVHITFLGDTGEGKTEGAMQFVKQLCSQGVSVDWVSYEQSHGLDLQKAVRRNNMIDVAEYFQISDPHADKDDDISYFDDFKNKVLARNSPDFYVIDSTQFSEFDKKDFAFLLTNRKCKKKGFIWISHKEPSGKLPMGILAQTIARLGHITLLVKNYIAEPKKNRFGGNRKYVIYEERARVLEPKFFEERDKERLKAKNALSVVKNEVSDEKKAANDGG